MNCIFFGVPMRRLSRNLMIGIVMDMKRRDFFKIMPLGALFSREYLFGSSLKRGGGAGLGLGRTE